MISIVITWLAVVGYLLASWQQQKQLFNSTVTARDYATPIPKNSINQPTLIGMIAWILHAIHLYGHIFSPQGLLLDFGTAASLTAWCVTGIIIVISHRQPAASLLVVMQPFSALCLALVAVMPSTAQPIAASFADTPAFMTHILLSFLAYALLAVAALLALVLATQTKLLKRHRPNKFLRLMPPLQAMDSLLFSMTATGVILLTGSLLSGFLFMDNMLAQQLTHKTVLSICAWFVFVGWLSGHYYFGWRGRTAVRFTLIGFGLLLVAYFGSKLIIEYLL